MERRLVGQLAGVFIGLVLSLGRSPSYAQEATQSTPSSSAVACVLRSSEGVPAQDARTAAALVCEALLAAGAQVDTEPVPDRGERAAYEVGVRALGRLIFLQVSFRSAGGAQQRSESVQVNAIEEVPVAARRLAEAMLLRKRVSTTAEIDNLVGEDGRRFVKRRGETLLALGVLGFVAPGVETGGGFGAFGRIHFETASFGAIIEARLAGSGARNGDNVLGGLAVGGRWFWFPTNLTPFLGAGAGIAWLSSEDDRGAKVYGSGFVTFAELGLEFMRFYSSRIDVFLRLDVPTFELKGDERRKDVYWLPVSFMASYSFG